MRRLRKGDKICPDCKGTGNSEKWWWPCDTCKGAGKLDWLERIFGKSEDEIPLIELTIKKVKITSKARRIKEGFKWIAKENQRKK
jgi:hypothetical protein